MVANANANMHDHLSPARWLATGGSRRSVNRVQLYVWGGGGGWGPMWFTLLAGCPRTVRGDLFGTVRIWLANSVPLHLQLRPHVHERTNDTHDMFHHVRTHMRNYM